MDIGARIRQERTNRDWTLEELKDRTGMSISFLSDIERGVSNPSLKRLKVIAEALDVSISYLLGEDHSTIHKDTIPIPEVYYINKDKDILSETNIRSYHSVEKDQVDKRTYFFIEANDNSMANSGIIKGSKVLIREQSSIENGEIAALFSSLEGKYHFIIREVLKSDDQWVLQAGNSNYEPLLLPKEKIEVVGKVIRSVHNFE